MAQTRPFRTLDTAVLGMTTYPFLNKWQGFDRWMPHLGTVLSYAALLGLFLFLGSPGGRLLLVIIAGSLVPYALTWRLIFDWRFTEHAYPFFLIASCFALWQVAVAVSPARLRALRSWRPRRKAAVLWVAALAAVVVGTWSVARVLPVLVAREAIAAGERTSVPSDERDGAFFGEGWSEPVTAGVVRARVSTDAYAHLRLPLSRVQDYDATLRMDPFPRPAEEDPADLPIVRVFLNNRLLSVVELTWNPERVGAYQLRIPAATVGTRTNRLVLMPVTRSGGPARIRFWYIRIGPAAASN